MLDRNLILYKYNLYLYQFKYQILYLLLYKMERVTVLLYLILGVVFSALFIWYTIYRCHINAENDRQKLNENIIEL